MKSFSRLRGQRFASDERKTFPARKRHALQEMVAIAVAENQRQKNPDVPLQPIPRWRDERRYLRHAELWKIESTPRMSSLRRTPRTPQELCSTCRDYFSDTVRAGIAVCARYMARGAPLRKTKIILDLMFPKLRLSPVAP
ncbi:hypothetical protein NM688_g3735 [Phlebia brevispora]|uniref:Uncharacterized protein n=1 Tax=Phlebia brevispora TaxID=194682 RepID=A0ACC1T4W6_9APHY|nr:hypothetical protein NM688_g3735 [Phlebia brevispora]